MANLAIICPVTGKSFQATFFIEQVVALGSRHEPVAVWCAHCERSHFVSPKRLLAEATEQDASPSHNETVRYGGVFGRLTHSE
jgi:hypothetical protein